MARIGADIIVEALHKENVEVLFGYPGGSVLDSFDKLFQSDIKFILGRHEQGLTHMADGYARTTGKPGVVIVTSGPGATNTVTGLATAYMDSVPMVVFTGQVPSSMIGNDAFQEADVTGITRPITKHNYLVKDVNELPEIIKEAFFLATSGRPGPVLIDLPKDVQRAECSVPYPDDIDSKTYKPTYEGNPLQIKKAAEAIKKAKRPVAYVGGGAIISGANKEVYEFIKKTGIPITTTLLGIGSFPESEPESLKMLGMHGTRYANYAVMKSDLLIAIGARFDDRVTGKTSEFAPHAKVIHIDIDPTSISKNIKADIPVVGDVKKVLIKLNKVVEKPEIEEWRKTIFDWKDKHPLAFKKDSPEILPQEVIAAINELVDGDAIICTDVGQHQMWATHFIDYKNPRSFLSSGGLGTMGYGLPASIGAKIAAPDKIVFNICGDGGFQMNMQELTAAAVNKVPVISIILNNEYLGMVRQWQELFYDRKYAMTCLRRKAECPADCSEPGEHCPPYIPDFVKIAEGCGCVAKRIMDRKEIIPALKEAIKITTEDKQPVVLEFITTREQNVYPMVPAGARLDDMLDSLA